MENPIYMKKTSKSPLWRNGEMEVFGNSKKYFAKKKRIFAKK